MKVAFCVYDINNLGGIPGHAEHLALGMQELGHETDLYQLLWRPVARSQHLRNKSGYIVGAFGIPVHMAKGWEFPASRRLAYKGRHASASSARVLSRYDLVIWEIPVPTKQRDNFGNTDWVQVYRDCEATQVAVVHDGNMTKAYPHICEVADYLAGVVCVHPCAYNSASGLDIPRVMILNPQPPRSEPPVPWKLRNRGWLACQTFKGWKHVHELIEAVPFMNNLECHVAGGGIEHNYLTSKTKCKPSYHHGPDTPWPGRPFWEVAEENGMTYHGWITPSQRDSWLQKLTCLVDPSWSRNYSKIGDHFNRTTVEAIRSGAIPIARPLGISTNLAGVGELFKPMEHYYPVPHDVDAPGYASCVTAACTMSDSEAAHMREAGEDLLQLFDRSRIATQYIGFTSAGDGGYYRRVVCPNERSEDLREGSNSVMENFFGA